MELTLTATVRWNGSELTLEAVDGLDGEAKSRSKDALPTGQIDDQKGTGKSAKGKREPAGKAPRRRGVS